MNKDKNLISRILQFFKDLSMSTQMILTVVFIFFIFFMLQIIFNAYFFQGFYADRAFDDIENELNTYVNNMNKEDADYFDEMYKFTTENNAMSLITTRNNYLIYGSSVEDYTLEITDLETNLVYTLELPNVDYDYTIDETISVSGFEFSEGVITPTSISVANSTYTYTSGLSCTNQCLVVSQARVDSISKPDNFNYEFENSHLYQEELVLLINGTRSLEDYAYDFNGETAYYYQTTINQQNVLVFIHELGTFDLIVTMIPIENTENIISIVSTYNNYVYLVAILIIFAWSFRLSKVLSTPIQNIEHVARQIANLNFDVQAEEYNNKENKSLTRSINLISKNLKETLHTLNHQNEELTDLYNEQIKQVSLKKQLVSSISHELKTPLMIMQVTIQGILDGIIDEENVSKELYNVLDEINKSSIMIQDMLQIYRLEDAQTKLEISSFSLSNELLKLISNFEHNLRQHELQLDLNIDQSIFIDADVKLIRRVLSNFLTNAIKYTPEGEKIYIEISDRGDQIYFELSNFGVQIADKDLDNIWMPFFRTPNYSNNRLPSKGSGIGLYLVSEILKAHEAEYGIENIPNGVKAYFILKKQD